MGVVLQADLVGFTPLAAAMSRSGQRGIERLHALLDGTFAAMTCAVEARGGRVVTFAGDALTAVFTGGRLAMTRADALEASRDLLAVRDPTWPQEHGSPIFRVGLGSGRLRLDELDLDLDLELSDRPRMRARAPTPGDDPTSLRGLVVLTGPAVEAAGVAVRRAEVGRGLASWTPQAVMPADRSIPVPPTDPSMRAHHRVVTTVFVHVGCCAGGLRRARSVLDEAARIVARRHGDLRQIEGRGEDFVLVLGFGAPRSHADDVVHAVACAHDLLSLGHDSGLATRAGIATGETFCAELGGPGHREYVVVGDSVNHAARLAQSASAGEVRIDAATARGCRGREGLSTRALGVLPLKGRAGQVAYAVDSDVVDPGHATDGLGLLEPGTPPPRSVGRDTEIAHLRDLTALDRDGPGRVVLVTGEPGIGTSHLLRLLRPHLSGPVAVGAGSSVQARTPYLPWRSVWREPHIGGAEGATASLPDVDRELAPLLATALGIPTPDTDATRHLSPADRAGATRRLLVDLLRRACRVHRRLTILMDDADGLDELSGRLLTDVARLSTTHPLVLVVAARGPVTWLDAPGIEVARSDLGPLDRRAARHLAAELLGAGHPRIEAVATRSGGNPLFLHHLAHWTLDRDGGIREERDADTDPPDGMPEDEPLPEDVRRVVLSRLDNLGPGRQSLVHAAAVAGHTGSVTVLSACARAAGIPLSPEHVEGSEHGDATSDAGWPGALRGLIERRGDATFAFTDPLVHDVAYATISLAVRSRLHEVAARTLEQQGSAPQDEEPARVELLAHHYGRSNDLAGQRRWIGAAARIAERDYATDTALAHLRRLVAIEREDAARADLWIRQAAILALLGRRPQAQALLERALLAAAAAAGSPAASTGPVAVSAARARRDLGALLLPTTRFEDAIVLLATAADELEAEGDLEGAALALDRLAFGHLDHGDPVTARSVARHQRDLADHLGSDALVAAALSNLALTALAAGASQRALELSREAHRRALLSRDRRLLVHTGNDLAGRLLEHGEPGAAAACVEEALRTARSIGYRSAEAALRGNLGELHRLCGDPHTATTLVTRGLRQALDLEDCPTVARCIVNLALCRLDAGDAVAPSLVRRVARIAVDLGQPACAQEAHIAAEQEGPVGPALAGVRLPTPVDLADPPSPATILALVDAAERLAADRTRAD